MEGRKDDCAQHEGDGLVRQPGLAQDVEWSIGVPRCGCACACASRYFDRLLI